MTAAVRSAGLAVLAAILAVSLTACGGDSSSEDATDTSPSVSAPVGPRPTIEAKEGTPPTELQTTDIVVGQGAEAKAGDLVAVQYVGALWDGTEFDSSWDRGQPFTFQLGTGSVIAGWDQGVAGMKVGGRRELVIPPDLAYGEAGTGPIPPNATLVFVVDLVGQAPADTAQ